MQKLHMFVLQKQAARVQTNGGMQQMASVGDLVACNVQSPYKCMFEITNKTDIMTYGVV